MDFVHLVLKLIRQYTLETALVLLLRIKASSTLTHLGPIAKSTLRHWVTDHLNWHHVNVSKCDIPSSETRGIFTGNCKNTSLQNTVS